MKHCVMRESEGSRMQDTDFPELLTAAEVAYLLRVSKVTVCRLVSSGKLQGFRVGRAWRVRRSDLAQYVMALQSPDEGGSVLKNDN